MALAPILSECIELIRTQVRSTTFVNQRLLKKNVSVWLTNARSYLEPTGEIDAAMGEVLSRCDDLLAEIDLAVINKTAFQAAQQQVFDAINDLEQRLEGARSSQMANHLGFGWS